MKGQYPQERAKDKVSPIRILLLAP